MRYCTLTLVFALLAGAIGCHSPHYFRSPQPAGPGATPPYFENGCDSGMGGMNGMGGEFNNAPTPTSQVQFLGPDGMMIYYDVSSPGMFDSEAIMCPGVHNFRQGDIYRLKLTNIEMLPGRDLYPTIEIAPTFVRTQAFLSHNMIPVEFTDNDFDQVAAGNFITKVVYLPNPEFQSLATAGVGTLVNTQLEPGVDPIVEAQTRGAILAVIRIGNKDLSSEMAAQQYEVMYMNEANGASAVSHSVVPPAPQYPQGARAPRVASAHGHDLKAPNAVEMYR